MEEKDTMELDLEGWVGSISGGDRSLQPLPPSASSFPGTIEMERGLQTDRSIDIGRRSRYESRYRGNVRSARLHDLAVEKGLRPRIGEERINATTVITGTPIVRRYRRDLDLKDADWNVLPNEITDRILSSLDPSERRKVALVSPEWGSYAPTVRYFERKILSKEMMAFFEEVIGVEKDEDKEEAASFGRRSRSPPSSSSSSSSYDEDEKMRMAFCRLLSRKSKFYALISGMLREMIREMGFDITILDHDSIEGMVNEFEIHIQPRSSDNCIMMIYLHNTRNGLGIRAMQGGYPNPRHSERFTKDVLRAYPYIRYVLKAFEKHGRGMVSVSTRDVDAHFLAESHPLAYQFGISQHLTSRSQIESLAREVKSA